MGHRLHGDAFITIDGMPLHDVTTLTEEAGRQVHAHLLSVDV
ncbi:hypothetical protein L687_04430 [Microbacterium maritypicum MF109]|uniref:Uncharacterized protein n=1 Tax=Microbacterium maritypicum MF109 TaxID=1333857 RepID=T5KIZ2_MICMQ|nr:hypothetical protein L687_04430 [Microbacterium maritypicum MF109]